MRASFSIYRRVSKRASEWLATLMTLAILLLLIVLPLAWSVLRGLQAGSPSQLQAIFSGPLSTSLIWTPFMHTVAVAAVAAIIASTLGCVLSLVIETSNIAAKRTLRALVALPFLAPSFALALAWAALFENSLVGGNTGILGQLGFAIPDALAWGGLPIALVLGVHYFPLSYFLVAVALARTPDSLIESALLTGASPFAVVRKILLPALRPALVGSLAICFAQAISNFAVPAILGTPARFFTLSTQLFRLIEYGQDFRSSVLLALLTLFSFVCLFSVQRLWGQNKAMLSMQVTRQRALFQLKQYRGLITAAASVVIFTLAIVPILALLASSLSHNSELFSSGFTLHYWVGEPSQTIAQGQAGILKRPIVYTSLWVTFIFGIGAATISTLLAIQLGLWGRAVKDSVWVQHVKTVSLLPSVVPSIAIGAAFITLYGAPIGPFPALYGSVLLLLMVGATASLPYAVQSSHAALAAIPDNLVESAQFVGASRWQTIIKIMIPLSLKALIAAAVLNFSRLIRNLDLVILVFTPAMPLLAVLAYRFSIDGFPQFANAIALLIILLSIATKVLADFLQSRTINSTHQYHD